MRFMLNFEVSEITEELKQVCSSARLLFKETTKVASIGKKQAGTIAIGMVTESDLQIVEKCNQRGGEAVEVAVAEFYYMLAVAYGLADRAAEGRRFYDMGRKVRQSGDFYEMCDTYYR